MALEKPQWKELFSEVVTSGLCTGCAACVIACPHPVLDYETDNGVYRPFHLDIDGGPDDCTHGQKGCTMCTRACPRFRNWESEIDTHKFARERTDDEVWGIGDVLLARYTASASLLAYPEAAEGGAERIALVGMGCMASAPGAMQSRKAGKLARRLCLTIGLMCSKTFDDSIFEELFEAKYAIKRADILKMNIKGVFQIWTRDGHFHEVPLKEAHAYTREGCKLCPDFAAEHADISTGGIGEVGTEF